MPLATVYSRAQVGLSAPLVTVEVQLGPGLPALSIVGLPETAVRESKDRVRGALLTCGFDFPNGRITINLAPADLPKEGGRFDLPIALGILAATEQLPAGPLAETEFLGELALSGELRGIRGVLPASLAAAASRRNLVLPAASAAEAALSRQTRVHGASHLLGVCRHVRGIDKLPREDPPPADTPRDYPDLAEVRGQSRARRALEVAAAGRHNLLLAGPPGTGKTMLANRLPGLLPALNDDQALEVAAVASVAREGLDVSRWAVRPFRAPHHSASAAALVGGGGQPAPGEISLAHHGVLFLDELPEFSRQVLEVLREPLESRRVIISRASGRAEFPAAFQLVAAMNPCPCGYLGESRCHCTPDQITRYRSRISGPLLDRIDLHVEVPRQSADLLQGCSREEDSPTVRQRVAAAWGRQLRRAGKANADLGPGEIQRWCGLSGRDRDLLASAVNRMRLSNRAYHRILRLARTIADLAGRDRIETPDITEAVAYRALDRQAP